MSASLSNSSSLREKDEQDGAPVNTNSPQGHQKSKTLKFVAIMLGMYLSVFLVALDRTIVATATPKITDEFKSLSDVGWYASAYLLTGASSNLVYGKLYKIYSTKWVFLASVLIFEIGSAVCGAAPNSIALIVGRAIAGLGSAGIFVGAMMIIISLVPLPKRPMYYSIVGAVFGISSVLGPLLGGVFTDKVSWRWCFYINLPIGAFTILALGVFLHTETQKSEKLTRLQQIKRLDPIGTMFFIPSIICLVLALQWGGSTYAWSNSRVVALLVVFAILLAAFCVIQVMLPETATVPVRIVAQRSVAGGALFLFCLTGSLMVIIYYLPMWFQAVKEDSAVHSGISLFPLVISLVVMSIFSGGLTQRIGYYVPTMIISPILSATGAGLLYTLNPSSNHSKWIGYQSLYGFGTGIAMQTASLAAQAVLPKPDVSTGMAFNFFAQQIGGAVFVPVAQNIFQSSTITALHGIAGIDANAVMNRGATNLRQNVPAADLPLVVNAFNHGITKAFLVSVGLSAASLLAALMMEWINIKTVKEGKSPKNDVPMDVEKDSGSESGTEPNCEAVMACGETDSAVFSPVQRETGRAEIK